MPVESALRIAKDMRSMNSKINPEKNTFKSQRSGDRDP
jgi:hypothetical protein